MKRAAFVFFISMYFLTGCATPNKHHMRIETTPTDALVSAHHTSNISNSTRVVSGVTPLETSFDFGSTGMLWLEIEKRGYAPQIEKVLPETAALTITLKKIKKTNGEAIDAYALPDIRRILLVNPDIKIIERGFSSEEISEEKSLQAQQELSKGIGKFFAERYEVKVVDSSGLDQKLLRPLWRDTLSAMELLDRVRLKYAAYPPLLETKSSRKAAIEMGKRYNAEVILFIKGKQNLETAGLQAGIAGTAIAGTAASFGGGYGRALSNNDSFFMYNIYTPSFGDGSLVGKAALINCSNGEVLWVNRGLLENVLTDLSYSLNQH